MTPHIVQVSSQCVPQGTDALTLLREKVRKQANFRLRLERLGRLVAAGRAMKIQGHPERVQAMEKAVMGFASRCPQRVNISVTELLALPVSEAVVRVTLHRPDGWPVSEYRIQRTEEQVFEVRCIDGVTRRLSPQTLKQLFQHSLFRLKVAPQPEAAQQAA